jgi:hypothetical protein
MKVSKKINLSTYSCNIHLIITDNLSAEVNRIYKKNKSVIYTYPETILLENPIILDNYYK